MAHRPIEIGGSYRPVNVGGNYRPIEVGGNWAAEIHDLPMRMAPEGAIGYPPALQLADLG